jgi:hypothetical protein
LAEGERALRLSGVKKDANSVGEHLKQHMKNLLKPHSPAWFDALVKTSPAQAHYTGRLIEMVGSAEVCSICGHGESAAYLIEGREYAPGVGATIRLCYACKGMHERRTPEPLIPVTCA